MDFNYSDNYDDNSHGNIVFVYMVIIMIAVIAGVTALIFFVNKPKSSSKGFQLALSRAESTQQAQNSKVKIETEQMVKSVEDLVSGSTLTSDQLDIWTLPNANSTKKVTDTKNGVVKNQTTGEILAGGTSAEEKTTKVEKSEIKEEKEELGETSLFSKEDEKEAVEQIVLTTTDGKEEQIAFIDGLERCKYDIKNFTYQKPEMKYLVDGKQASTFGVTVSAQNKEVDFSKMKRAGCDYVMVRIGQRGYSSGKLVMDSAYKNNLEKAKKAGLYLGAYFSSQAINREEVLEEADVIISALEDYNITYPVMFDMEAIPGELARTDGLDVDTRTSLAIAFMKEIKNAGYMPILYGDLEWLLLKLDLEALKGYDICVAQTADTPEYPYDFQMWQYQDSGTLNGIDEKVRLFVNMKDY